MRYALVMLYQVGQVDVNVALIKDYVQIASWLILGTVAVLTYRKARQTILQPIRTEVFRIQLVAMTEIMRLFHGKSELDLRGAFAFSALFLVNAREMYDAYTANFFDKTFDIKDRPYNSRDCPLRMGEHVEIAAVPDSLAVRQARWAKYQHDHLHINRQYMEMEEHLTTLLTNPVLPLDFVELLTRYRAQAAANQIVLMKTLEDGAREMPERFPTLQSLDDEEFPYELQHQYMANFEHLEPLAIEIVEFIRSYFDAENLMRE